MRPQEHNCRPLAVTIFATLLALITALAGFGPRSTDPGIAEAGHRAGYTGDVRIVTKARLGWVTCSEGRRA